MGVGRGLKGQERDRGMRRDGKGRAGRLSLGPLVLGRR